MSVLTGPPIVIEISADEANWYEYALRKAIEQLRGHGTPTADNAANHLGILQAKIADADHSRASERFAEMRQTITALDPARSACADATSRCP